MGRGGGGGGYFLSRQSGSAELCWAVSLNDGLYWEELVEMAQADVEGEIRRSSYKPC